MSLSHSFHSVSRKWLYSIARQVTVQEKKKKSFYSRYTDPKDKMTALEHKPNILVKLSPLSSRRRGQCRRATQKEEKKDERKWHAVELETRKQAQCWILCFWSIRALTRSRKRLDSNEWLFIWNRWLSKTWVSKRVTNGNSKYRKLWAEQLPRLEIIVRKQAKKYQSKSKQLWKIQIEMGWIPRGRTSNP